MLGHRHFVSSTLPSTGKLTLDGVTITGGEAPTGSGLFNNGTLVLINSAVTGNGNELGGSSGSIENRGTLTVTNSLISGNVAARLDGSGGGINNTGDMEVTDSAIRANSSAAGGGISNAGTLRLTNTTISNNSSTFSGGGIENFGEVVVVEHYCRQ